MTKIKKILIFLAMLLMLTVPVFSYAQKVLVTCGISEETARLAGHPEYAKPCDFTAFLNLINTFIRFILFDLAIPICAIMFFYAGFLLVTSGGSTEAKSKAKSIFSNTVYGLVFIAGAWLIIRTILSILGYNGAWIGF